MYYDISKTLSKQRLLNFVLGPRGCGKSFAFKKQAARNFIKKGEQFVYLRRYDTELPAAEMRNFFDDIKDEFPDHEFSSFNGLFRIDKQIAGWYFSLSTSIKYKSVPFPNVTLIGFDEFVIEQGFIRYLPNEVRTFLECYSTISRDRDVPCLFLSNSISKFNPYFVYFDIKIKQGVYSYLFEDISVEYLNLEDFKEHMHKTRLGRLLKDTDYGKYAFDNQFLLDTDDFVSPLPAKAQYICTFKVGTTDIGLYSSGTKCYLSYKIDRTCKRVYAVDFSEHTQSTTLIFKTNSYIIRMMNAFSTGELVFESEAVKSLIMPKLKQWL